MTVEGHWLQRSPVCDLTSALLTILVQKHKIVMPDIRSWIMCDCNLFDISGPTCFNNVVYVDFGTHNTAMCDYSSVLLHKKENFLYTPTPKPLKVLSSALAI